MNRISDLLAVLLFALFMILSASLLFASPMEGTASFYGAECCKYNPDKSCPTASGRSLYELQRNQVPYAAMWGPKFGTRVKVTNLLNQKSVEVEILDRGPAKRLGRIIDLSPEAFARIADPRQGLCRVTVEVLA